METRSGSPAPQRRSSDAPQALILRRRPRAPGAPQDTSGRPASYRRAALPLRVYDRQTSGCPRAQVLTSTPWTACPEQIVARDWPAVADGALGVEHGGALIRGAAFARCGELAVRYEGNGACRWVWAIGAELEVPLPLSSGEQCAAGSAGEFDTGLSSCAYTVPASFGISYMLICPTNQRVILGWHPFPSSDRVSRSRFR